MEERGNTKTLQEAGRSVSFDLTGKAAVVTGAGGVLGQAIARTLSDFGAAVVLADLRDDLCLLLARQLRESGRQAAALPCDVTDRGQVARLTEETVKLFGRLDIMVNNAGIDRPRKALSILEEDWDTVMNVNLKGTFFGCVEAARRMIEAKTAGRIINLGSAGAFLGTPNMAAYCASKAAVVNLTKTLAMEWGTKGITVNAVCPGYTPSDINAKALAHPQVKEAVIQKTALKRLGTPEEVAAAVLFLASDVSSMITGTSLAVDMGTTCN